MPVQLPVLPLQTLNDARDVWNDSIQKFGRLVDYERNEDGVTISGIKAFCKRPKILGLFDRTEQSYDQERYMVLLRADALGGNPPVKFDRFRWDGEDHAVISVTVVDLQGVVFGYRVLVKG